MSHPPSSHQTSTIEQRYCKFSIRNIQTRPKDSSVTVNHRHRIIEKEGLLAIMQSSTSSMSRAHQREPADFIHPHTLASLVVDT